MGIDWSSKIENKAQKDLSQYGEIIHLIIKKNLIPARPWTSGP
jgi:hypothetical protein